MAVNIPSIEDRRAEQILQNPDKYFAEARQEVRQQVQRELQEDRTER